MEINIPFFHCLHHQLSVWVLRQQQTRSKKAHYKVFLYLSQINSSRDLCVMGAGGWFHGWFWRKTKQNKRIQRLFIFQTVFYLKLRYFIDGSLTSCSYQVTVNPHISWLWNPRNTINILIFELLIRLLVLSFHHNIYFSIRKQTINNTFQWEI